jgi:Thiamine biosynthesis enzyme ThiH and related uncharacterized enzymes
MSDLSSIAEKVHHNERLSFEDGVALYRSSDLMTLARAANELRERLNGNVAYYNVNRHINYTNVCAIDCQLCQGAYAASPAKPAVRDASGRSIQVRKRGVHGLAHGVPHCGGLNPDLPSAITPICWSACANGFLSSSQGVHMVELDFFTKITKKPLDWVISTLREAGMGSCPGGGAEIFAERARPLIAGHKMSGNRWLEVAREVHKAGMRSNATMLYGHIETLEERVDHLIRLRDLQDETHGFQCFIPLAFHPENTFYANLPPTTVWMI